MELRTEKEIIQNWEATTTTPLVSIRCTTYNHEKYIKDALNGFLNQVTTFPFEVIVHDDASTDKTAEVIKEYEKKYPTIIKPIYETENQYSKRDGSIEKMQMDSARGIYIAFCEGDDYWIDPLKLQKQVEVLEKNADIDLVYSDLNFYNQQSKTMIKSVFKTNVIIRYKTYEEDLVNSGYHAPCTWVYRRNTFQNYLTEGKHWIDGTYAKFLEVEYNSKAFYLDCTTSVYRILNNSASHSKSLHKLLNRVIGIYQIKQNHITKNQVSKNIKKEIEKKYAYSVFPIALACKKYDLINNLKIEPDNMRAKIYRKLQKIPRVSSFLISFLYKLRGYSL